MDKRFLHIMEAATIIVIFAFLAIIIIARLPTSNKGVTFIKNGSFVIQNGDVISFEKLGNTPVLHWYFDPSCKSCRQLHAYTKDDIKKISGVMPVQFHPVNYLTNHQKQGYSLTASALILSVVKNDRQNALEFLTAILDENFTPYTNDKPLSEYKAKYHGSKWNTILDDLQTMKQIVEQNTKNLQNMKFPYLIVEGTNDRIDLKSKPDGVSYSDYIIDKIKELKWSKAVIWLH